MISDLSLLTTMSNKLSNLEIKFNYNDIFFDVEWFRVCIRQGNWKIEKHKHSSFEFHFIACGDSEVITDNGTFKVEAGQFYLARPHVYHFQQNGECDLYIEYSINVDISLIDKSISLNSDIFEILSDAPCVSYDDTEQLGVIFETALREANLQKQGWLHQIHSSIIKLLFLSSRIISENSEAVHLEPPVKYKNDDHRFIMIEKFIRDNIAIPITVNDLSNHIHLCNNQVSRIVKKKLGITPHKYISNIKVSKAKKLLRDSDLSIKEVSEHLGFPNPYSFSTFFKNNAGVSPKKFRDKEI